MIRTTSNALTITGDIVGLESTVISSNTIKFSQERIVKRTKMSIFDQIQYFPPIFWSRRKPNWVLVCPYFYRVFLCVCVLSSPTIHTGGFLSRPSSSLARFKIFCNWSLMDPLLNEISFQLKLWLSLVLLSCRSSNM